MRLALPVSNSSWSKRSRDGTPCLKREVQTSLLPLCSWEKGFHPALTGVSHHPAKFPLQQLWDLTFRARKRFLGTEPHLQQSQSDPDSHCRRSREKCLEYMELSLHPPHQRTSWQARRLDWLNRELWLKFRKKGRVYDLWRKGQTTPSQYKNIVRLCREKIRSTKA